MSTYISNPLFSIIVPVYNVKNYVGLTISSILHQTFTDFELIVIDDGSTDGSGELLDEIVNGDSRVRVFHQSNSGVSAARNLGLNEAEGEWIVFVDGDDALKANALQLLSEIIIKHPAVDLIGYGFEKVQRISIDSSNVLAVIDSESVYDCRETACLKALDHYMVWGETFRKAKFSSLRFKNLKNGEDVLFCNALGLNTTEYVALNTSLYLYLQRDMSARNNKWTERRHSDFIDMNWEIMRNIMSCQKRIDPLWLKRWIGSLLQYNHNAWKFDRKTQLEFFAKHRSILKSIRRFSDVPFYLKSWIRLATIFNSKELFKIIAMKPMKIYSKLLQ